VRVGLDQGEGWLLVGVVDVTERSRRLTYLLDDGSRRSLVIGQADDDRTLRRALGDGLVRNERREKGRPPAA